MLSDLIWLKRAGRMKLRSESQMLVNKSIAELVTPGPDQ